MGPEEKAKTREYWHRTKPIRNQKQKEYYQRNKEEILEENRLDRINNPEKFKEYGKKHYERQKRMRKEDPQTRLRYLLRSRVKGAILKKYRGCHTLELLGATPEVACAHLESLFQLGMTWENSGKWHIDHITPCASFDLTKLEEQKRCFNYKNLQPLWGPDNLRKGKKLPHQLP
jgi:hypothetical protein